MRHRSFFGEPYLLTEEQLQNPLIFFHSFFDSMHLVQAREFLNELKSAALTSTKVEFSTPMQRDDVIYLCEQVEKLVEAAYVVKGMKVKRRKKRE